MYPKMTTNTPNYPEGNPALFVDAKGHIWLFYVTMYGDRWTECKVYYRKSNAMGTSWGERGVLREELGWMTRNKPLYLSNGEIVLPVYDERNWHSMVMISEDGGETWNTYGDLSSPKGVIQPTVVQRGDGSLLMLMRSRDGEIWRSTSDDSGRSWEAAHPTNLPNPDCGVDMVRLRSGNIALVYNDKRRGRTPLTVALSTDEGETWGYKRNLETEEGNSLIPRLSKHVTAGSILRIPTGASASCT